PLVIVRHLEELRRTAQDQGLYFNTTSAGGGTFTYDQTETKSTTSAFHRHFSRDLVFFFETKPNQNIRITVNVRPDPPSGPDIWEGKNCTTDFRQPGSSEVTEVSSQSAIVIVRGGATLKFESICWSGAVFNQSGELELAGNSVFIGTIWTEKFTSSGTNTIKLDSSWFGRIPAGFRDVQRRDWVECESFVSPSC
ncbi:MAG: hypothetical protein ACRD1T_09745, partial [Acidimicrobiia bacterium]